MGMARTVPDFYKKDRFEFLGLAAPFPLLGGFVCCFLSLSTPKRTFSDWFGFLIGLFISTVLLLTAIRLFYEAITLFREKRNWFKSTDTAKATIVNRQEVANDPADVDYAYSYGQFIPSKYWYLTLKMIPSQLGIKPGETLVSVGINESQYKRYDGRTSVTIYYSREHPFVFLLEDEI